MSWKHGVSIGLAFVVGIGIGGYLFKDTRPRSFLDVPNCHYSCLSASELAGLLTSIGIQRIPAVIPVVKETDKVIVIDSPVHLARTDFLILPKKDIRDLGDLSAGDETYIVETFQVIGELIRENNLQNYRVLSNGPGYQQVNYLHFHLLAK